MITDQLDFDLFEFQAEDVQKLLDREGVLIGNEMGSGKTYEAIALDALRRQAFPGGKTLVICPLSQATRGTTWDNHYRELCPDLKVCCIDSKKRQDFVKALKSREYDVYIMHWDAVRLIPELTDVMWMHIIADEAHRAKNRKAQQTRALKKIKGRYKTALSGTPITNKPHDFWSILNWLYPRQFSAYWKFYNKYVEYEIVYPQGFHKIVGCKNERELLEEIGPFYVRHLKKAQCCPHHPLGVMPQLPEKYNTKEWVELLPVQRKAYDQMNKDLIAWVGEQEDTPLVAPVVIAKLIRLQQFAVAYADVDWEADEVKVRLSEPSAKLDRLMEIISDNEGESIVVFSQFSQAIQLLGERLRKADITHGLFTGATSDADRARIVSEFQAGDLQVFAGTIKAGGVGLDLFRSSTVIFLDRSWSPAENLQAEDRLHRHGQRSAVQVIDLMARNTVDLGREQMLIQKWDWIKRMLGDT